MRNLGRMGLTLLASPVGGFEPAPAERMTLRDMEARFIYEALRRHNWNRTATARELGIHKTTLWRKIKGLDLDIPDK